MYSNTARILEKTVCKLLCSLLPCYICLPHYQILTVCPFLVPLWSHTLPSCSSETLWALLPSFSSDLIAALPHSCSLSLPPSRSLTLPPAPDYVSLLLSVPPLLFWPRFLHPLTTVRPQPFYVYSVVSLFCSPGPLPLLPTTFWPFLIACVERKAYTSVWVPLHQLKYFPFFCVTPPH